MLGDPAQKLPRFFAGPEPPDACDLHDRLYDASMSLAKKDVRKLIDTYIRAWTTQDPELILPAHERT